ncbi:MAG: oligosaccharide flippase family protein [Hyphomonadaceae bacterium]|nr:oligosaccharide flippase family protein [Hyphomonadaceae bacterium]
MSLMKRAVTGLAWAMAGGYGAQLVSLAMFIYISRLVGPEAFGAVAVAIAIIELCRSFTTEAVATTLVAQPAFDEEAYNAGFAWALSSTVVTCVVLMASASWLADMFRTPSLVEIMPLLAPLLVLFGLCRLQEARLAQQLRFRALAGRAVVAALGGGGVGVLAAIAGLGVEALIYQQIVGAVISALLLWNYCDWRPSFSFSYSKFRSTLRPSFTLAPAGLVASLCALADGLAVAMLSGPVAAGVYNLGKRVRIAMLLGVSGALDRVSLPVFAQLRHEPARLTSAFEQAVGVSGLVIFPLFFGVAAIAPELVHVLLGAQWAPAAEPIALLLIAAAVAISTMYCENVLLVLERRGAILALRLFFLLALFGGLATFGTSGPTAVAATALAATVAQSIAAFVLLRRATNERPADFLGNMIVPLFLNLAMFTSVWFLRQSPSVLGMEVPARLALLIGAGALLYMGLALAVARHQLISAYSAARNGFRPLA